MNCKKSSIESRVNFAAPYAARERRRGPFSCHAFQTNRPGQTLDITALLPEPMLAELLEVVFEGLTVGAEEEETINKNGKLFHQSPSRDKKCRGLPRRLIVPSNEATTCFIPQPTSSAYYGAKTAGSYPTRRWCAYA